MEIRKLSLVFVSLVGCATAVSDHARESPDAQGASGVDAPPSSSGCSFSGALATWSFTGQPGSETSIAASASASGVTASDLTRAAGLTATAGSGSINASGWATSGQLAVAKYYTMSLTPPPGCSLDITSVAIDARSSSTGPAQAALATSADGFAQPITVSTTAASTPTLSVSGAGAPVEIRIYGFAASGAAGTMRLQNTLTITGALR